MRRIVFAMVAAAVVLSAVTAIRAQPTQATLQRSWRSVVLTTVKPERVAEWLEIQKSQTIPMQQKGGIKERDTWQSGAPFGEGNTYTIVTPIEKFATYDMPQLSRRVLGDGPAQTYQNKLAAITVSRRTLAIQDRVELSILPAANAKFAAAILTDTTIVSGHAEQYEAYVKNDLVPLLKKDNVLGYLVSRTTFGGNANEYHSVLLISSFADIDRGPAQTRLLKPAEAAAMAAKVGPHVEHVERTILRYVPDLSYRPKPIS